MQAARDAENGVTREIEAELKRSKAEVLALRNQIRVMSARAEPAPPVSTATPNPPKGGDGIKTDLDHLRTKAAEANAPMQGTFGVVNNGALPGALPIGAFDRAGGFTGQGVRPMPDTLHFTDYLLVHKPKSDKVSAYSNETGKWATYTVPKGVDVLPIGSVGVAALYAKGDEINQIATFVPREGKWYPLDLKAPAKEHTTPLVSAEMVVYAIGRRVYAFSAMARRWDTLELEEGAKPIPNMFGYTRATVEHKDHLYVFSLKTGQWSDFDAKTGEVIEAESK
jgi:hypothetical protein